MIRGSGRASETHPWALLEMWSYTNHISFKISVQDIVWTLMEMDLLFYFLNLKHAQANLRLKSQMAVFLVSLNLFFFSGVSVTNKLQ